MEILKTATDWAKAEVFSTSFFIVFGLMFLAASIGFYQLGKTDLARAYIVPALVAGVLLLIIGMGLVYTNVSRVSQFETAYHQDASAFVAAEVTRARTRMAGQCDHYDSHVDGHPARRRDGARPNYGILPAASAGGVQHHRFGWNTLVPWRLTSTTSGCCPMVRESAVFLPVVQEEGGGKPVGV